MEQNTANNLKKMEPPLLNNTNIEITYDKTAYNSIIQHVSKKYEVNPRLIEAIIHHESKFDANAKSTSGAIGLMQLMPHTARSLGVTNPYDPAENIEAGTKYISQLLQQYDGNISLALAAYNAGPGNVSKYGGIPPFEETQNYVTKVLDTYNNQIPNTLSS